MQQQLDLASLAATALNEPILMEPAYARVFLCALAGQLGISRITDAATGVRMTPSQPGQEMAIAGFSGAESSSRCYAVQERIAVIPVTGMLIPRSMSTYSWATGYDGIIYRLQQAMADPGVDGVVLDMNTPGGLVSGAFDCADMIARLRDEKPIWAIANDMNCSAGQLIASACSRRMVTQTATVGSIGVMMAHSNYAGALEQFGVEITLLYSGKHKVDGNPWSKLEPDVRSRIQERMDATRLMFAEKVAAYSGLSVQAVLDTEALVYEGAAALDIGLADELVINSDAIGVMRDALSTGTTTGVTMSTNQPQAQATAQQQSQQEQSLAVVDQATSQQLSATDLSAAVQAENQRIMGIIGCQAAQGREAQARELAATPGMTVEAAERILLAGSQSAQVRTDTALDALMTEQSPAPVNNAAPAASGDTGFDLLMTINPLPL